MKISELKAKQGKVDVEGKILEISPAREFQKYGRAGKVANSMLEDDSGKIVLTLWNEDVDTIKVGDTIKITNGFVNEWQGELQLTSGRFGNLEVVGDETPKETEDEPEEE